MENSSHKGPIIYFCKQTQHRMGELCKQQFWRLWFFYDMPLTMIKEMIIIITRESNPKLPTNVFMFRFQKNTIR